MQSSSSSPYQLHIQLPSSHHANYMQQHMYQCMPGTPTPSEAVDSGMSGDESPSESRKSREMAPFLRNLRNMLERENPEVLRWSKDGTAFEIHDMDEMMNTRQLNYFNFKKWTKSRANVCTFSNEYFTRHEPYRSTLITRKKSMSSQKEALAADDDHHHHHNHEEKVLSRKNSAHRLPRTPSSGCSTPTGYYSCDSPVAIKKEHLVITNGSLDSSFNSMSLHKQKAAVMGQKASMDCYASPYENKHLTRVMGKKQPAPQRVMAEDLTAMHDELDWIADSDLENIRDSVTSLTSTHSGGEWDDNDMNWVDLLPYNDPSAFESGSDQYMRQQFVPVNGMGYHYAATI
ncbi:hypothetical protein SPRG_01018 [Saprolegnia parasitica CBS 223.65]|uniref:HSF-type DNA-binding domain-containing protein n=2 Tax=Saprolegnia parasitica (strain CBS 223.65) TaxID=695850 RepID=A0A067D8G9_SAPPC|nr:hypothetical protein SPRG_01018 [Saprolegnia parasitica CBS 223.65]KDO34956.1 hypothetical protein SPRG_01018 [Saprolegnia parasitica CBS 223.65]|eukprot:XP_012194610.1 hypothetical protein SPRG_01018 [Saprolegnia parasitica CBS 223.65]